MKYNKLGPHASYLVIKSLRISFNSKHITFTLPSSSFIRACSSWCHLMAKSDWFENRCLGGGALAPLAS